MRKAFTIVELLVVIAVIAILVALLIPAIQSAREAGRRITCANHMKQISLSVINYSSAKQEQLPGLWKTFRREDGTPASCYTESSVSSFGWRTTILPFLEEQNLFDQIDFGQSALSEVNRPVLLNVLPVFQCPSTPGYPRTTVSTNNSFDLETGSHDYSISHGPVLWRPIFNVAHAAFAEAVRMLPYFPFFKPFAFRT